MNSNVTHAIWRQSGRPITTRHREHTWYIRTNNPNSAYVMHILNNKHEYGRANEMLKLLKSCNKGLKMNCWESFYIQIYRQCNRLITEQLTGDYNPLYEQACFPRDLQHIPWHSLGQIGTHTHTHTHTHTQTEWIDIQPHTDTLYNKCKSTFQFSNLAKYGHGPPEDGFKGDQNM